MILFFSIILSVLTYGSGMLLGVDAAIVNSTAIIVLLVGTIVALADKRTQEQLDNIHFDLASLEEEVRKTKHQPVANMHFTGTRYSTAPIESTFSTGTFTSDADWHTVFNQPTQYGET